MEETHTAIVYSFLKIGWKVLDHTHISRKINNLDILFVFSSLLLLLIFYFVYFFFPFSNMLPIISVIAFWCNPLGY